MTTRNDALPVDFSGEPPVRVRLQSAIDWWEAGGAAGQGEYMSYIKAAAAEIDRLNISISDGNAGWIPMSQAPAKTGRYLVWIGPRLTKVGELRARAEMEHYTADGAPEKYFGPVGWKTFAPELDVQTHWMPLPEAPK